ncbi:MAG: UDP-N-acetylmuramoyl-tripeptide--D-alanyl-D-alanine ligase [Bacilli bacterium]|nr:UDP-N-acetylmuramoyl-tripeptide--D-alanyl-D-alanine ligase [Bacilli bacterium]
MNINDLILSTKGKLVGEIDLNEKYKEIKTSSLDVKKGDVFVALIGNSDGHKYVQSAIDNGAKILIVSKKVDSSIPYILVKDTTLALGDIAHYMVEKYKPRVIALTGSVGKTTTRNILLNLLSTKYNVVANEKNFNNHIGVPLTVFNLKDDTEILLSELGMNHLKEISYLSKMINPETAIITNIGSSHIGNLGSKEEILKAKLEILDGMDKKILFVNGDDELLKKVKNTIKSGFNDYNDLIGYDLKSDLYSSSFKIKYHDKEYKIEVNLPEHLLEDVLLSINVALYYGVNINDIIKALKEYKSFDMRMNILEDKNGNTIINDCYNSSFESLIGVLKILENEKQKKLLILGSILELGDFSKAIHRKIKPYLDKIENKKVILVGEDIKALKTDALYFDNYEEVISCLEKENIKDTLILIKGSRGIKLENVTNYFMEKDRI